MSLDTDAALDIVTEEVVEAAVSAFLYKRTLNPSRSVTTILDIGEPPQGSWKCRLAVGGWKRVCINLVSQEDLLNLLLPCGQSNEGVTKHMS